MQWSKRVKILYLLYKKSFFSVSIRFDNRLIFEGDYINTKPGCHNKNVCKNHVQVCFAQQRIHKNIFCMETIITLPASFAGLGVWRMFLCSLHIYFLLISLLEPLPLEGG